MRYPPDLLARIRDELSTLYPERGDILRVLAETGIAAPRVRLEQDAQAVWHDIVTEAHNLGLVRSLLTVAMRQYASGPVGETLEALLAGVAAAEERRRYAAMPPFEDSEKNGRVTGAWNGSSHR